ncbi:MAG: cytochrome c3 family protein [Planctomycetota bacterium]
MLAACTLALIAAAAAGIDAQENEDCLECHGEEDLKGTRDGKKISVFVEEKAFARSAHGDSDCIECHADLTDAEFPHARKLKRVRCATCHDEEDSEHARGMHGRPAAAACGDCHGSHDMLPSSNPAAPTAPPNHQKLCGRCHEAQAEQHARSFHGRAWAAGEKLAPTCGFCHGHHEVRSHRDPGSPTATMNIPVLCGTCHHEGSEVSLRYDIPQHRILENYSQSIHGEGLFKKGLTVTAVCTSCHTSHEILEHTDPKSSIHHDNVAATCTKCHARIESVHVKVIEGRLWEEEPHKIPTCTECHSPHRIRRQPLAPGGAANRDCLKCHSDRGPTMEREGKTIPLFLDEEAHALSAHGGVACAQCHTEVRRTLQRPCEPIRSRVDCSICHAEQVRQHGASVHGTLAAKGDPDAPTCLDCHEKHATQSHRLPTARTFPRNVPDLCARCHREGEAAAKRIHSDIHNIVRSYTMSIHGKGLVESGLIVSATCTDCHTAHHPLPAADPASSVHPSNVADTCGSCHHGIEEIFKTSIHWPANAGPGAVLPNCEDCHTSHSISRTDVSDFRFLMMDQCGKCHTEESETFFDTFHGKVSHLGSAGAAKCYDCHGTHDILPITDPRSHLSRDNVVATCGECHAGAHRKFAGYLTHATHHDPVKYPFLYFSFWGMTALLVGTLTVAMLHTLLWLWRLWRTRHQWRPLKRAGGTQLYLRFRPWERIMHLIMLLSFFTLALTGMALKFSYMRWAHVVSSALGGSHAMGVFHRLGAAVLMILFAGHLCQVWMRNRRSGTGWRAFLFSKNSLLFNRRDLREFWQSIKWFLGRGERPRYGRWTYWEKFDYFAVFWGIFVIGSTGLVLWFPELFTHILPGWSVNVVTIIHSDEALLAVGFIFTIHFFNTHFRPDKFPMDPVIFTGRVPLEELKHDKPEEYAELAGGDRLVAPVPQGIERAFRIFGFVALGIGLTLIFLICYTMIFGYR